MVDTLLYFHIPHIPHHDGTTLTKYSIILFPGLYVQWRLAAHDTFNLGNIVQRSKVCREAAFVLDGCHYRPPASRLMKLLSTSRKTPDISGRLLIR